MRRRRRRRRLLLLWLVCCLASALKGGGKKAGKAKGVSSASPEPRRITSATTQKSGLSLRRQLSLVKAVKSAPKSLPVASKKRKEKAVSTKSVFDANEPTALKFFARPMLLVDGYNVICGSDYNGFEDARRKLCEDVAVYARARGLEAKVVFDGREKNSERVDGIDVVFTAEDDNADDCIQRFATERRPLGESATIVASDDGVVRLMADAVGCDLQSVQSLVSDIKGAKLAISSMVEANNKKFDHNQLHDLDASNDLRLQLRRSLKGKDTIKKEEALAATQAAIQTGLKNLLKDLDSTTTKDTTTKDTTTKTLLYRKLKDIEENVVPNYGLEAWLHQQKLLFGHLDLMVDTWWDQPHFKDIFYDGGGP